MHKDPVFDLRTPIVFAHRGGAGEVPESTELAFRHAIDVGVDVLELDLNVTSDGEIVVWHGPELDKAYVDRQLLTGKSIQQVKWADVAHARVLDPRRPQDRSQDPRRKLLRLEEFVKVILAIEAERGLAGTMPWNVELKGKIERWEGSFARLFASLNEQVAHRKIVLAAARSKDLRQLRSVAETRSAPRGAYAFNLATEEQFAYRKWMRLNLPLSLLTGILGIFVSEKPKESLVGYTLETSHALVGKKLVDEVHRRGGAIHAFLTAFTAVLPGVEHKGEPELRSEIQRLLETGIDGIMTDFPERVVPIVRQIQATQRQPLAYSARDADPTTA